MSVYMEKAERAFLASAVFKRFLDYEPLSLLDEPEKDYKRAFEMASASRDEVVNEAHSATLLLLNVIHALEQELEEAWDEALGRTKRRAK